MFLVRWIATLLAAPLVWLGRLAGYANVRVARALYAAAWRVSRDPDTACLALGATSAGYGEQAALALSRQWLQDRTCPAIAAYAGLLALQVAQVDLAWRLLGQGKQAGTDRNGMLDLLEWLLVSGTGDGHAVRDLAGRWASRHDLQPLLSRQVLTTLLWEALQNQRFDEALHRARHLLSIEDVPQAQMALWALAKRDGDIRQAEACLRLARLEPRHKLSYQILGNAAIGFLEEARALLAQLEKLDPAQAALAGAALNAPAKEVP